MAFVPVADAARFELRFLLDEQRIENTLWFTKAGGFTSADLATACAMLAGHWLGGQQENSSNQLQLREVYGVDMSSETAETYTYTTGLPASGTIAQVAAPNALALCVSFRTAQRGRSARGRNYVAGLPQTTLVSNSWDAAYVNDTVSWYSSIIGLAADNGMAWVIASLYSEGAPRIIGQTLPVIAVVAVDNTVDTQRRRSPGRGT